MKKFNIFTIVLLSVLSFVSVSCKETKTVQKMPDAPTNQLHQLNSQVKSATTQLSDTTSNIKSTAQEGKKITPAQDQALLNPYWEKIIDYTTTQDIIISILQQAVVTGQQAEATSKAYEKAYTDQVQQNIEAKKRITDAESNVNNALKNQYRTYSGILFFLALICGVVAVASKFNPFATYGAIGAGIGCVVSIFIVQTLVWIPYVVGGLGLVTLGLIVYSYWKNHVNSKIISTQLVKTVEAIKPDLSVDARKKLFGDGPQPGMIDAIQNNPVTAKTVSNIKSKIRSSQLASSKNATN
jgi:hypothetical protein